MLNLEKSRSTKFSLQEKLIIILAIISFLVITYENLRLGFDAMLRESTTSEGLVTLFTLILMCAILLSYNKRKFIKTTNINLILTVYCLYFFFLYGFNVEIANLRGWLSIVILLLWIFSFKFGMNIAQWEDNKLYRFILLFSIFIIVPILLQTLYIYHQNDIVSQFTFGNDVVFFTIVFFPFVLLLNKNRLLRTILTITFLIISFLSYKRTIIISSVLVVFTYYILISDTKSKIKQLLSWRLLIVAPILIYSYKYVIELVEDNLVSRFQSLKTDGGSGRDTIYKTLVNVFINSTPLEMFFGHGYESTKDHVGMLAHNDTLQILFDLGLIGLFLYLSILYHIIKLAIVKYKKRDYYRTEYSVYVASLISYLALSQLNCFIYEPYILSPIMFLVGVLYYRLNNSTNEKNIFN